MKRYESYDAGLVGYPKVYVVQEVQTGKEHAVGSTCSRKLFGWEPEPDELRAANKTMRSEQKRVAYEKYEQ